MYLLGGKGFTSCLKVIECKFPLSVSGINWYYRASVIVKGQGGGIGLYPILMLWSENARASEQGVLMYSGCKNVPDYLIDERNAGGRGSNLYEVGIKNL